MKKHLIIFTVLLAAALSAISALAAAGSAVDPLISLSYLNGTYKNAILSATASAIDSTAESIRMETADKLADAGLYTDRAWADTWLESRLKYEDALYGSTGLSVLLLAGNGIVSYSDGAVIDVSTGDIVPNGSALIANHRYMVAEDTTAYFTITSKTAVVNYMGQYGTLVSDALDYNAIANALKKINLFRGSSTGYGSGFDLEAPPTRLQALIMFIRVLGEEEAALANTDLPPFSDIYPNTTAAKYVGYAWKMGYTGGYSDGTWRPGGATNIYQYCAFLLRALGYSTSTNISTAPQQAQTLNLMTEEDLNTMLNERFLRAHLAYLSYRALEVPAADSSILLHDQLIGKGVFTKEDYAAAIAEVNLPNT